CEREERTPRPRKADTLVREKLGPGNPDVERRERAEQHADEQHRPFREARAADREARPDREHDRADAEDDPGNEPEHRDRVHAVFLSGGLGRAIAAATGETTRGSRVKYQTSKTTRTRAKSASTQVHSLWASGRSAALRTSIADLSAAAATMGFGARSLSASL